MGHPLSAAVARQRYAFGQASDGGSEGMAQPDPHDHFAELDAQRAGSANLNGAISGVSA